LVKFYLLYHKNQSANDNYAIGKDLNALLEYIKDTMLDKEYITKSGNVSKAGKYHSHNVSCMVLSQEERDAIFKAFQDHESVEMVI